METLLQLVRDGVALAILIGLVQIAKLIGLSKRFLPLLAVLLGVGLAFLVVGAGIYANVIILGLTLGLSACGLYSGIKSTIGK